MSATHKGPGDDRSGGATNAALGGAGAVPPPIQDGGRGGGVGFVLGHADEQCALPTRMEPTRESVKSSGAGVFHAGSPSV